MKPKMIIKEQKGVAAVEFAIVLPLFLMLVFGIIEFGLLLYNKAMITNAAREGARAGIVYAYDPTPDPDTYHMTKSEIQDVVVAYAKNFLMTFGSDTLEIGDIDVCVDGICSGSGSEPEYASSGASLTVEASYKYNFLIFPNMAELIKGSVTDEIDLKAVTVMRFE